MPHPSDDVARAAVLRWGGDPASLRLLSDGGHRVHRFRVGSAHRVMRLAYPELRPPDQNDAELAFIEHLVARGLPVAHGVRSERGRWTEIVDGIPCVAFEWVPGAPVRPGDPEWGPAFVREWGGLLARVHDASRSFDASAVPRRFRWDEEPWIADGARWLAGEDDAVRGEFDRVCEHLRGVNFDRSHWGVLHGDLGPGNLLVDEGSATVIDFGNAAWGPFALDLSVALATIPEGDVRARGELLDGYGSVRAVPIELEELGPWFRRLRDVYVLISRLWWFGPRPDEAQRTQLDAFRARVISDPRPS